jgi:hypothetical protein
VNGTSDKFRDLVPVDVLPQRDQGQHLLVFNWSGDTFNFIGATGATDLQLRYESNGGTAPTNDADHHRRRELAHVPESNYAVGVAGPRKGYDEIAARARMSAVGPRYDQGGIGGELFRLIQTRVSDQPAEDPPAAQAIFSRPPIFAPSRCSIRDRQHFPGVYG